MKKYFKYTLLIALWLIPIAMLLFSLLLKADYFQSFNKNPGSEIIDDMDYGLNLDMQSENLFFKNKGPESFRPKHSVPISSKLYDIEQNDIEGSLVNGDNILPDTKLVRQYGGYLYRTHCACCHNFNADGRGAILTKVELKKDEEPFPNPPDIRDKNLEQLPDSRVFHILSAGQNLMFSVSYKLNDNDKWAIINYLRTLQNIK